MFSLKMSKTFSDTSTNQQFIEISRFHFNFHNAHIENELIFYHFRFNFHRPITPSRPWAQENDRLTSKSMVQKKTDISKDITKFQNTKVVTINMENEDITNHFEWAIMLLKHQFDKDPYSLTTDQVEVLKLHHQIELENKVEE